MHKKFDEDLRYNPIQLPPQQFGRKKIIFYMQPDTTIIVSAERPSVSTYRTTSNHAPSLYPLRKSAIFFLVMPFSALDR